MKDTIRDFFEKYILILHEKAVVEGKQYLNMQFDDSHESYFSSPQHPQLLYLNNIPFEDALKAYLTEFWKDEPELLNLVPALVELAFQLKKENMETSTELSPFVYAMF